MIIVGYTKKNHKQIITACVHALKQGKVVAYPTDTSYGLAVDATSIKAIKKLYKIKERGFKQPVHVIVPSLAYAKKIAKWNKGANKLAGKFWPGPLTLVLPVGNRLKPFPTLKTLSARTGFIGLRYPDNKIALDLAKYLQHPITTTSANPSAHLSGGYDSFNAVDVIKQFEKKKYRPDIVINAGKLPKRKPSTFVKIMDNKIEILREGPIAEEHLNKALRA